MKEKAQSTTPWLTSMKAIEAYCVGKKASDLTKTSLDAVTGATLVDAPNYLKLVSEVAGERRHHHDGCVCRRRFRPQDGMRHRGCSR